MLVRNLREPGDYRRAILLQDENLKLAIANEQNIAAARSNLVNDIIPEQTQAQKRSLEETLSQGISQMNQAKNNLSSIFTDEQVASFMTGLNEDTYQFINVYWTDLKKELETKKDLTKVYFDKILRKLMSKLEQQAGISVEAVERPGAFNVHAINSADELSQLIPDRDIIRQIAVRLVPMDEKLASDYLTLSYMLPHPALIQAIEEKDPVTRQELFTRLQLNLRGVNPRTSYWTTVLNDPDPVNFIASVRRSLPDLDGAPFLFAMYSMLINPGRPSVYEESTIRDRAAVFRDNKRRALPPSPIPRPRRRQEEVVADEEQMPSRSPFTFGRAATTDDLPMRATPIQPGDAPTIGSTLARQRASAEFINSEGQVVPPPTGMVMDSTGKFVRGRVRSVRDAAKARQVAAEAAPMNPFLAPENPFTESELEREIPTPPSRPPPISRGLSRINAARAARRVAAAAPEPPIRRMFRGDSFDPIERIYRDPDVGTFDDSNQSIFMSPRPPPARVTGTPSKRTLPAPMPGQKLVPSDTRAPPARSGKRYGTGVKSGKGIAMKEKVLHDLGKFTINGNALENQLLQIKYQNGGTVPGFSKKMAISDTLHELLNDLIETGKLNKGLLKELDAAERKAIETILLKSGIGAGLGIKAVTPDNTEQTKIDRFNLLLGSYNAGNNANELIQELRALIIYFMKSGYMNKKAATAALMDLH